MAFNCSFFKKKKNIKNIFTLILLNDSKPECFFLIFSKFIIIISITIVIRVFICLIYFLPPHFFEKIKYTRRVSSDKYFPIGKHLHIVNRYNFLNLSTNIKNTIIYRNSQCTECFLFFVFLI